MGGGRFLGLANDMMLDFMFRADIWFIDATFKPVRRPFRQLLVVHVVFNQGARQASIPVFYILMSNRTTVNYMRCFKSMLGIVEHHGQGRCGVRTIMIDFEYAMWQAFRNMIAESFFDNLTISGCLFHFCQCLYRRVQRLHLSHAYKTHRVQRVIMKSLMALPLLPLIHIKSQFERLHKQVKRLFATNPVYAQLLKLCVYVSKQWINGNRWSPPDFCQYENHHRTNNICEGYHSGLRHRLFQKKLSVYKLLRKLWAEAENIPVTMGPLYRGGRLIGLYVNDDAKQRFIQNYWIQLRNGLITAKGFLVNMVEAPFLREDPIYAKDDCRIRLKTTE